MFLKAVSRSDITATMDEHVGAKPAATNIGKNTINFRVRVMVFNGTFNNISVISWWSVLLVEETGGPGENHRSVASH